MGSWNETCAISGFPIFPGDRIKMLLLEERSSERGKVQCYSTDMYAPVSFPISGVYADYGDIEGYDPESISCKILLKALSVRHIPVKQGENEYHEHEVPDLSNWDNLLTGLKDGRILLRHQYAEYRNDGDFFNPTVASVIRVYVLERVWNEIASSSLEDFRGDRLSLERLNKEGVKYFTQLMDKNKLLRLVATLPVENKETVLLKQLADISVDLDVGWNRYFTGMTSSPSAQDCIREMKSRLFDGTLTMESPEFQEMLNGLSELILVNRYLESIRFAWHVTCGSGSQEGDYMSRALWHARLAKLALEMDEIQRRDYDDDTQHPHEEEVKKLFQEIAAFELFSEKNLT